VLDFLTSRHVARPTPQVELHRKHWWACRRCGAVVKRAMNRPPTARDCREYRADPRRARPCADPARCPWHAHLARCGGEFDKVRGPSLPPAGRRGAAATERAKSGRKPAAGEPAEDAAGGGTGSAGGGPPLGTGRVLGSAGPARPGGSVAGRAGGEGSGSRPEKKARPSEPAATGRDRARNAAAAAAAATTTTTTAAAAGKAGALASPIRDWLQRTAVGRESRRPAAPAGGGGDDDVVVVVDDERTAAGGGRSSFSGGGGGDGGGGGGGGLQCPACGCRGFGSEAAVSAHLDECLGLGPG
jgi:hypothetical protein